jgi:hypothetical protein
MDRYQAAEVNAPDDPWRDLIISGAVTGADARTLAEFAINNLVTCACGATLDISAFAPGQQTQCSKCSAPIIVPPKNRQAVVAAPEGHIRKIGADGLPTENVATKRTRGRKRRPDADAADTSHNEHATGGEYDDDHGEVDDHDGSHRTGASRPTGRTSGTASVDATPSSRLVGASKDVRGMTRMIRNEAADRMVEIEGKVYQLASEDEVATAIAGKKKLTRVYIESLNLAGQEIEG